MNLLGLVNGNCPNVRKCTLFKCLVIEYDKILAYNSTLPILQCYIHFCEDITCLTYEVYELKQGFGEEAS